MNHRAFENQPWSDSVVLYSSNEHAASDHSHTFWEIECVKSRPNISMSQKLIL